MKLSLRAKEREAAFGAKKEVTGGRLSLRNIIRVGALLLVAGAGAMYVMKPAPKAPKPRPAKAAFNPLWPPVYGVTKPRQRRAAARPVTAPLPVARPATGQKASQAKAKPAKAPPANKAAAPPATRPSGIRTADAADIAPPAAKKSASKSEGPSSAPARPAVSKTPPAGSKVADARSSGPKPADAKPVIRTAAKKASATGEKPAPRKAASGDSAKKAAPRAKPSPASMAVPAKAGLSIRPHLAFYKAEIHFDSSAGTVKVAEGGATSALVKTCAAWTSQFLFDVKGDQSMDVSWRMRVHAREAADGNTLKQRSHTKFVINGNGQVENSVSTASRPNPDALGEGFEVSGQVRTLFNLPRRTLFPFAHMRDVLKAALSEKFEHGSYTFGTHKGLVFVRSEIREMSAPARKSAATKVDNRRPRYGRVRERLFKIAQTAFDTKAKDRAHVGDISRTITETGLLVRSTESMYGLRIMLALTAVYMLPNPECGTKN